MLNFEHEVAAIRDRAVRFFLLNDYFHDSLVLRVQHDLRASAVEMRLWCNCEHEADDPESTPETRRLREKLLLCGLRRIGLPPADSASHHRSRDPNQREFDRYIYVLRFEACLAFIDESTVAPWPCEYLNGRFKDSPLLRRVRKSQRRQCLHLRIQTTAGYLDIVFGNFAITRTVGRIVLPRMNTPQPPFAHVLKRFDAQPRHAVRNTARGNDEFLCAEALAYLARVGDRQAASIAADILQRRETGNEFDPREPDVVSAIYALGICGRRADLERLWRVHARSDEPMFRRHVLDAIERIQERLTSRRC